MVVSFENLWRRHWNSKHSDGGKFYKHWAGFITLSRCKSPLEWAISLCANRQTKWQLSPKPKKSKNPVLHVLQTPATLGSYPVWNRQSKLRFQHRLEIASFTGGTLLNLKSPTAAAACHPRVRCPRCRQWRLRFACKTHANHVQNSTMAEILSKRPHLGNKFAKGH